MKLTSFIFGTLNTRQRKKGRRVSLFHRQTGHHKTAPAQSEGHFKERRSISVCGAQIKLWGEGSSSWVPVPAVMSPTVPLRTVLVSDSYLSQCQSSTFSGNKIFLGYCSAELKNIIHPPVCKRVVHKEMNILPSFTHPHVIQRLSFAFCSRKGGNELVYKMKFIRVQCCFKNKVLEWNKVK